MKTSFAIGMRVNVSTNVTESWQSCHQLFDGVITKIYDNGDVRVLADEKTTHSNFCFFSFGGRFSTSDYIITSIVN